LAQPAVADWYTDVQEKMGTRVEIQLWSEDPAEAARLLASGMAEFDRIEALMSTYMADSEMSRINRFAADEPQLVTAELFGLLQKAQEISELTDGAFDITFDSVGQFYDFRQRQRPDALQISEHIDNIDYRQVVLNEVDRTVAFKAKGVRINLGGIAKGHAVEKVIDLLSDAGVTQALATAGGDTRILGKKGDKPWVVGIRDPNDEKAVFTRVALDDEAISTSGDYERFFVEDGVRYHHILSPASGRPVSGVRSVSVIGPSATVTDGLSTSVFVMGSEKGMELIARLPDYEALIVTNTEYYYSPGLSPD
jgi:thiamine biosynthesis lipoprotein